MTLIVGIIGGICAGYVLGLTRPLRMLEAWNWGRVCWGDTTRGNWRWWNKIAAIGDLALWACFHPGKFWRTVVRRTTS